MKKQYTVSKDANMLAPDWLAARIIIGLSNFYMIFWMEPKH